MPRKNSARAWKYFDAALCKTAAITFNTIQFVNGRMKPNPSFTPAWSEKPLLKS